MLLIEDGVAEEERVSIQVAVLQNRFRLSLVVGREVLVELGAGLIQLRLQELEADRRGKVTD